MSLFADTESSAVFSECNKYRYQLTRRWGVARSCAFVMLNPSTADAENDDPTIRRCIGFAKRWGFGGVHIYNLFAYRSTDPRELRKVDDPVGPDNDAWLIEALGRYPIVAAWGAHGTLNGRDREVAALLNESLWCIGVTKDGHPRHPLYVRGDADRVPWEVKP